MQELICRRCLDGAVRRAEDAARSTTSVAVAEFNGDGSLGVFAVGRACCECLGDGATETRNLEEDWHCSFGPVIVKQIGFGDFFFVLSLLVFIFVFDDLFS